MTHEKAQKYFRSGKSVSLSNYIIFAAYFKSKASNLWLSHQLLKMTSAVHMKTIPVKILQDVFATFIK